MKKKIVIAVFIAAIAIAAGYTMQQNAEKNDMSDIVLANVEALAQGESDAGWCAVYGCDWNPRYFCRVYTLVGDYVTTCWGYNSRS